MSNFDNLFKAITEAERIDINDIENIGQRPSRKSPYTKPQVSSGIAAGEEGLDPENVETSDAAASYRGFDDEENDHDIDRPGAVQARLRDLINHSNRFDPAIIEDESEIQAAIEEFLGRLGYTEDEEADEEI